YQKMTARIAKIIGSVLPILATLAVSVISLAAQPSASWQTEWERVIKAAEQEGEVNYYAVGEVGFVSEFEKRFSRVKVKVIQGRGNELLTRIMAERRGGRFLVDVARIGN